MYNRVIFLSDVHIGAFSAKKNAALESNVIRLIDLAEENGYQLVIVGDLFDYWIEYRNTHPRLGKRLLKRVEQFHKYNRPTLYITGNHDCWPGSRIKDAGFDIEMEYRIVALGNRNAFIHHGDGLSNPALALPRSRVNRLLRSDRFISAYTSLLPAKIGIKTMQYVSQFSKLVNGSSSDDPERLNVWSQNLLENSHIDAVISGHDHIARSYYHNDKQIINLGEFESERTIAVYNSDKLELVTLGTFASKLKKKRFAFA